MPDRFHIPVAPMPGKFRAVGKYGSIDWREDCSRCSNCVKLRCQYNIYRDESAHNRDPDDPVQPLSGCKACLSCVMGCTKGLLELSINPEYLAMGDEYWTPDIIATTQHQADAGKIPVTGSGYRGKFSGPGFDSIWTDMSEIVRPTRDGIHGREYISTTVDIGPKPMHLAFGPEGQLLTPPANLIEVQMPVILDLPPWSVRTAAIARARVLTAKNTQTLAVVRPADLGDDLTDDLARRVVPLLDQEDPADWADLLRRVRMIEMVDSPDLAARTARAREINPALIVAARLPMTSDAPEQVSRLVRGGHKVIHLCADHHGREIGADDPLHLKDALRAVHGRLLEDGDRDAITLIVSGGIALPEHMAKAILCGADLVAVGEPLLVALGCRVCRGAHDGGTTDAMAGQADFCPAQIAPGDVSYAAQRMTNLMGAWHSQLIEVLGAMGIREVRRLRGETGRAIFREDIEEEAFGDLIHK